MSDATTADKLAAWELIDEYELDSTYDTTSRVYAAFGTVGEIGYGQTRITAVRAWAEAAGVPWPSVNVVPMWCSVSDSLLPIVATANRHALGGRVVPCEVVIRTETEGV